MIERLQDRWVKCLSTGDLWELVKYWNLICEICGLSEEAMRAGGEGGREVGTSPDQLKIT